MSALAAAAQLAIGTDRPSRFRAIDAAKGISILLVVLLHLGSFWQINVFMSYIRMPLFFFTAGLFAAKALSMKTPDFLKRKVGNLFYIYIVWVGLHFLIKYLPTNLASGLPPLERFPTFSQLINPDGVLWFIYALGIVYLLGKFAFGFNRMAVLGLSFAAYCLSFAFDSGREDFVIFKIAKLFVFFMIAVYYSAEIREFYARYAKLWLLLAVCYLAGRYVLFRYPSLEIGPIPFLLSAVGISSVFMFCFQFSGTKAVWFLAAIGSFSLSLYLLHGPVIFYVSLAFKALGIEKTELAAFLSLPFVVLACWVIGMRLIQRHLAFLYTAPWLRMDLAGSPRAERATAPAFLPRQDRAEDGEPKALPLTEAMETADLPPAPKLRGS